MVLKDNAYGHGLSLMAPLCHEYGIKKAVVRNQDEALKARDFFEYILVLADIPDVPLKNAVYTVNSIEAIEKFPKNTRVEIKTDSGMHRNGVSIYELDKAFFLCIERGLHVEGVFTHHRSADELSSEWFTQEKNFKQLKEHALGLAKKYNIPRLNFHSQNSAALFRAKECMHDMVRVGIAAYGCLSEDKNLYKDAGVESLQPVLSLYASKISSRLFKAGERIGYGGIFEADKDMVVSTYDVGYADGLLRKASNNFTTPDGSKILGRISMDNVSINSDKEDICIFDNANSYAASCDTIGYEILVGMRYYIKRSVI